MLHRGMFAEAEEEFKHALGSVSNVSTDQQNARLRYFAAATLLRRVFAETNHCQPLAQPVDPPALDDAASVILKDQPQAVALIRTLVEALRKDNPNELLQALDTVSDLLDEQLIGIFSEVGTPLLCLSTRYRAVSVARPNGMLKEPHYEVRRTRRFLSVRAGGSRSERNRAVY